jgi:hypothetical protein
MAQPAGVYFQYRADDAAATYSTSVSAGVADSSGNARPNVVAATSAARPTLTAGGAGGHSYLTFDGVDDRVTTSNATDPSMVAFGNAKAGLTLSAVVKFDPTVIAGATKYVMFFTVGGANGTRFSVFADGTGNWGLSSRRLDTDATVNLVTTTPVDNQLHHVLGVVDYSTATQRLYLDGVLIGSQAAGTTGVTSATNSNTWSWGSNATPAAWMKSDCYEISGYDRALTTTEVADYWAFEQARYAIAGAGPVTAAGTASFTGSGTLSASGSTAVTRLRVLRAGVSTSGAANLRVLRAAVTTETAVQANAGAPVTADSLDTVVLSAEASSGTPTGYAWTQTSGPAVTLRPNGNVPRPEFTAPATDAGTSLGFSLAVTSGGTTSANTATVTVTVRPHIEWLWLGGVWTPVLSEVVDAVSAAPALSSADNAVLADTPVAYFPLDGANGSDVTGSGMTAVAVGSPATVTMPNGDRAAQFNGASSYYEIDDDPALSVATTGQLTLEMWVRPDVLDAQITENTAVDPYVYFAGKGVTGQHEYAARFYNAHKDDGSASAVGNRFAAYAFNLAGGTAPGVQWTGGVASTDDGTPPVLTAGQWVHVAVVIDTVTVDANGDGVISLYRNGVLMDHRAMTGITPGDGTAPLRIGTRDLNSYFQGAIGKVAVYSKAVSAARLLAHYHAVAG